MNAEVGPKRLELLHELVPTATIVALLVNPTNPTLAESTTKSLQAAARTLGVQLHVLHSSTERDFEDAFATLAQRGQGRCWSAPIRSLRAGSNNSPHWRTATRCPRRTNFASSLRQEAW